MTRARPANGRQYAQLSEVHRKKRAELNREYGRSHKFVMFRTGEDICGKCGLPRAAHITASTRTREP